MPFFQNLFNEEFRGTFPLADRQYNITFRVPANTNSNSGTLTWTPGPYDLSSDNTLTINIAKSQNFKNFFSTAINVAGATASATTAQEIVDILRANVNFSDSLTAEVKVINKQTNTLGILIKAINPLGVKFYISNSSAEKKLNFNGRAGVAEMPTYYAKHIIGSEDEGSLGTLMELDTSDAVDQAIITEAGFDYTNEQEDWELLGGRAEIFKFQKQTVDESDRITQIIEYPAGAIAGDLARLTKFSYTSSNKNADKITQVPYTLQSGDLVTP
ncbi:MAG: hypothetical protein WCG45_04535 [bacterium]